jgi:alkanesulfonate monooxygenase SsuD/methylene tetrahydromethanopterin reductase-like flavin-dependent oxidoreductase (luciferase family)
MLANQAASLDVMSGGRFTLGVGTGWDAGEFAALGVPFRDRGARVDEHLTVMRELWRRPTVEYQGRYTTLAGVGVAIRPRTPGGPPVLVGGHSDAALRRALRFADGWVGTGVDPAALAGVRKRLAVLGDEVGRDPATLRLTSACFLLPPSLAAAREAPGQLLGGATPTGASVLAELGLLREAGLSACSLWMPVAEPDMTAALDWVAENVMPGLDGTTAG